MKTANDMTMTRRSFFGRATAVAAMSATGCVPWGEGDGPTAPNLRVGVLSDVHLLLQKDALHSDVYFEKALRWYDKMGADAVLLCGDIADCGLVSELEYAADIWNKVFPDGWRSDGGRIQQLFHLGDHDFGGFAHKYSWAAKCSKDPDAVNHALVNENIGAIWERLFGEKWAPIQVKTVKGYTFVLAHHPRNMATGVRIPGLAEALAAAKPDPGRPFFYSMHRPIHPTLPGCGSKGIDDDPNYQVLRNYPNVLAFFGHSHRNSADELALWQGAFTVVHVPSTSYCCTRGGRENSFSAGNQPNKNRPEQMQRVDCFSSNHALFMDVYDDRVVISRRDVRHDASMGADWVIPLPSPDGSCSEEARAAKSLPPAFPSGATASVSSGIGKDRAKKERPEVVVTFPPASAVDGRPRAFDYEIVAEANGVKPLVRRVFSTRAYWPDALDKEPVRCVFGQFELPADRQVSFTVRPANCFGALGEPLPPVYWAKS